MRGAVIFLHGEEETAYQLKLKLNGFRSVNLERFLIKNKIMPVFLYGEMMKNESTGDFRNLWFNKPRGLQAEEQVLGINLAYARVLKPAILRIKEKYAVEASTVLVGGYSLGGDMGLQMLRLRPEVGGVWCIACYLPESSEVYQYLEATPGHRPPAFMAHGELDDKVPLAWARSTQARLEQGGVPVEFTERPSVGHWLEEFEVVKLADWIARTYQAMFSARAP